MFDRFMLFLGASTSAMGVAFQGVALAGGAHAFTLSIVAICASSIGAGCLAVSPSIRNGMKASADPTPVTVVPVKP